MNTSYYAGIGSRQTPEPILKIMARCARWLATRGWVLRSGHAAGADRAFEFGAAGAADIYLPWTSFGQVRYKDDPGCPVEGRAICEPRTWESNLLYLHELGLVNEPTVPGPVRPLFGRNVAQVLGLHTRGDPASKMVICWAPIGFHGKPLGGTAVAIRLAEYHQIPVLNLYRPADLKRVLTKLEML